MNMMPKEKELELLRKTPVSMAYTGGSFEAWQVRAREKLRELLGMEKFHKCEECFRIESVTPKDGYTVTRFSIQTEEDYFVPCCFVEPAGERKKRPVVVCLQGHGKGMHISLCEPKYDATEELIKAGNRDFAMHCVRRNLCAVTVEQRCFGEKGGTPEPDCYIPTMTALLTGRTTIGGRVWDVMRVIDAVENHFADRVDTERVYCMGNSGGGTATIYASALEPRIKGAMPSCAFCTYADSICSVTHCACNYIPHIREYFDMAELVAMSAPKPMVITSGIEDKIFPIGPAEQEFARVKEYYSHSEKPGNCAHVKGNGGHRFYEEDTWRVFEKLSGC